MRPMRGFMAVLALILVTSCAPLDTRYAPISVVIDVRDAASGDPVAGAAVLGGVNALFNPDSQPGSLGRPGGIPGFVVVNEPSEWITRTDESGRATTSIAGGNPTSLVILKDGYDVSRATIRTNTTLPVGFGSWSEGLVSPVPAGTTPVGKRLEFRVLAADGSGP